MASKAWYDIHSHFLPGVDDGCKSIEESIRLLQHSRKSGILGMIATPHYYPEESIEQFLQRRQEAASRLRAALESEENEVPAWCLGAEAAYYEGLVHAQDLEKLCLGQSRYLLLELPFDTWGNSVIRDIYTLSSVYGITPVIAHLERYLDFQSKKMLQELYEADVVIQMNGGYILNSRSARNARKRIAKGYVQVLGSDAHNMSTRKPNLREAVMSLESAGMAEETEHLRRMNRSIFSEAMGIEE